VSTEEPRLRALEGRSEDPAREAHAALEAALFEVKRVIVGQEGMLERLLVALLAGGHVLLEAGHPLEQHVTAGCWSRSSPAVTCCSRGCPASPRR